MHWKFVGQLFASFIYLWNLCRKVVVADQDAVNTARWGINEKSTPWVYASNNFMLLPSSLDIFWYAD